jgi:hypothetical protein
MRMLVVFSSAIVAQKRKSLPREKFEGQIINRIQFTETFRNLLKICNTLSHDFVLKVVIQPKNIFYT